MAWRRNWIESDPHFWYFWIWLHSYNVCYIYTPWIDPSDHRSSNSFFGGKLGNWAMEIEMESGNSNLFYKPRRQITIKVLRVYSTTAPCRFCWINILIYFVREVWRYGVQDQNQGEGSTRRKREEQVQFQQTNHPQQSLRHRQTRGDVGSVGSFR